MADAFYRSAEVDVLIPAYNVGATIAMAVRSMLEQTVRAIRVVVVDDGSTDDTALIVKKLAEEDPRVHLVQQPNGGVVEALNNGLAQCTAPIIARQDGDDVAYPERLALQLAYLQTNPDCVAVGANMRIIDDAGAPTGHVTAFHLFPDADAAWFPAREPYLAHPTLMVRRQALNDVGAYRYVFHAEDADLYWRLREVGRLHNLSDVLGDYRVHTGSVSGKSIVNGRVQAACSQLAALSALRRKNNQADIDFPKEELAKYNATDSVDQLLSVIERGLRAEEKAHFRLAVAGKMVELASYRPYRLQPLDSRFIRNTFTSCVHLADEGDRDGQRNKHIGLGVELLRKRDVRGAFAALPLNLFLRAAYLTGRGKLGKEVRAWLTALRLLPQREAAA